MAPRNSAASRSASAPPAAIPPTAFPLPANRPPLGTRRANRPQPATSATRNLSPTSPSAAGSKHRQAGQSGNSPPPRRYRTTGLQSGRQTITAADPPPRRPPAGPRNHQPRQLTCVLGWPNSGEFGEPPCAAGSSVHPCVRLMIARRVGLEVTSRSVWCLGRWRRSISWPTTTRNRHSGLYTSRVVPYDPTVSWSSWSANPNGCCVMTARRWRYVRESAVFRAAGLSRRAAPTARRRVSARLERP